MRFHVISLPHTQTTKAYSACAYTEKVRKFCNMMTDRGDTVYLYAGEENEARCSEHICCIDQDQQKSFGFSGPEDYLKIDFNSDQPWRQFHHNALNALRKRLLPRDFILVITGFPTKIITDTFPNHPVVEFGVGYSGICHKHRVFESNAWRNFVYGQNGSDGHFFDETIPNYFETEDFSLVPNDQRGDYLLYIGRLTEKKGWRIAQEVSEHMGKQLIVAGPGEFSGYGDYVGVVPPEVRNSLMGSAQAVFVPTLYVAPFEGVHIEANLCGTPVLTTDFGVFTETVDNEVNGLRCKGFSDFVKGVEYFSDSNYAGHTNIRDRAVARYSTEVVRWQYAEYFSRLNTLWDKGWYA